MSAQGVHKITELFEQELAKYTGAPYVVAVDNGTSALFLSLYYELNVAKSWIQHPLEILIPASTYPSVPCSIIQAGAKVIFQPTENNTIKGAYQLWPTRVWDSALRFTTDMYKPRSHMCLSFTGPYKIFKLSKAGAILTDNEHFVKWAKKARFSGRDECSYFTDDFDKNPVLGWNYYLMPEIAARGLLMMPQFYNLDGTPKKNEDLILKYPDLSKFKLWQS